MRPEDMRDMSETELEQQIAEAADELFTLRLRGAHEELENPMRIRQLKRDIARMKTIKRERELAGAEAEES